MPKLIKLTDEVGAKLEALAQSNNVSMAKQVALLLDQATTTSVNERLDKLAAYLEAKFAELKHSIEDTTVDRLSVGGRRSAKVFITDWEIMYEIMFTISTTQDWVDPAAFDSFTNSDLAQEFDYYIQDNQIRYAWHGADSPIINLTPNITNFLKEKGVL